jgi:hypothetical protein
MEKVQLSKAMLHKKYIDEKKSVRSIASETGWGKSTILKRLYEYGISVRKNTTLRKGMRFNKEWRKNISDNHADVSGDRNPMHGVQRFGKDSPGWQGGKTPLMIGIRRLQRYSNWRFSIFERDSFTCTLCKDASGGNLEADHIEPLSYLVSYYEIKSTKEADNCAELWYMENGRTLCQSCHKETDTYGTKALTYRPAKS